jgi:hypothetical protein
VVPLAGAVLPHRQGEGRAVLPESKNRANRQWGFPGNLGDPDRFHGIRRRRGLPHPKNSRSTELAFGSVGAKHQMHRVVPPSEGNEARREGRQEVVAP